MSPVEVGWRMSGYTDEERMWIAKKEYDEYKNGKPLQVSKPVKINGDTTLVGYVADVNHNDDNGEDSYVITDTRVSVGVECVHLWAAGCGVFHWFFQ